MARARHEIGGRKHKRPLVGESPSIEPPVLAATAVTVTVTGAGSSPPTFATFTMNSLSLEPSTIFLGTWKPDSSLIETS